MVNSGKLNADVGWSGLNSITGSGVHVHVVFQGCRVARDRVSMLHML